MREIKFRAWDKDKQINKYLGHFMTITKHKFFVGVECFKRGLYWQGFMHDWSKYSPTEFLNSAKYWNGKETPIGLEKADKGYSEAWLHHKGHNKHHWEYWVDWRDGKQLLCKIPDKYILEMACDIIGASKAYRTNNPLGYFLKNKKSILMERSSKNKLQKLLRNQNEN